MIDQEVSEEYTVFVFEDDKQINSYSKSSMKDLQNVLKELKEDKPMATMKMISKYIYQIDL